MIASRKLIPTVNELVRWRREEIKSEIEARQQRRKKQMLFPHPSVGVSGGDTEAVVEVEQRRNECECPTVDHPLVPGIERSYPPQGYNDDEQQTCFRVTAPTEEKVPIDGKHRPGEQGGTDNQ